MLTKGETISVVSVAKINHMRGVKMVGVTIARRREDADTQAIPGFGDSQSR